MEVCIIVGFSIIVGFAAISLIGAWISNDSKGMKISCTITIVISIVAFLCAYLRNPFYLSDGVSVISTISTIISIPVAVLLGWNIYTVIDIKKIKDDYEKAKLGIRKECRKELLEYKGKIDGEVTELNKNVIKLEEMISNLDIYGGNKGKWAIFEVGISYNKEESVKIIHKIHSFYENLGVDVRHIMTEEKDDSYSLVFENGGISQLYLDRFKERLMNEFKLQKISVKIKEPWSLGIPIKRNGKFYFDNDKSNN